MSSIAGGVQDDKVRKATVRTLSWSTEKLAVISFVRAVGPHQPMSLEEQRDVPEAGKPMLQQLGVVFG